MRRWINRIVLIVVLGGIVAALVWSMWPQPVPVEVVTVGRGPLQVSVVEDGRAVVEDRYLVTAPLAGTVVQPSINLIGLSMSGFQVQRGVAERCWAVQLRRPATAEPCVPSTCRVRRSSRRTRTSQEELKWQITPLSNSKVAYAESSAVHL